MSNYVDFKINGRLFPSWILLNFGKYKLPPQLQADDGSDPCLKKTKKELRKYQKFITKYLDYRSPYKNILLYHGMGSGKTTTTINIYNMLYNYTPDFNMFILCPASLHATWDGELLNHPSGLGLEKTEINKRYANIKYIHYDSPFANKKFLEVIKESDSSKKTIFVIDEVHNFINNVYNNVTTKTGQRAYIIYDYIIQLQLEHNDVRVILLTGTPAINKPFELALMFNLLRPNTFPNSETKFLDDYVSSNKLRKDKINRFQRRITGLISYYGAKSKTLFAKKIFHNFELSMSEYQTEVYNHFNDIEKKADQKNRMSGSSAGSTYRSFTRSSCNFTFPVITGKIRGENRPRPSSFKVSDEEAQSILEGKKHLKGDEKNTVNYLDMVNLYLTSLDKYMKKINDKDLKNKYTIMDDIEAFKKQYNGDYIKFSKSSSKKSNLFTEMKQNSCKMTAMIFNSFMSKGPLIFFSNYVKMEGLDILKLYLKFCGFSEFKNKSSGKDYFRYTEYHGSIDVIAREKNKENFNEKINIDGKLIKIILISPAGSEGISLSNVRQVHILDPYWNEVRIEQLIARAVRICSHEDLKMKDRIVDIFRYYAVKPKSITTDIDIRNLALKKKELIESFLLPVKEIAIDCELNKADNSIDKKKEYTCFKFDQTSLFNNTIGPAYKQDIYYDSKIDNGLNSINSQKIKIKVKEIFAVKKIENSDKYTEQMKFWLDEDNGIIYDYKHDFPIGKISFDEDDIPNMISQNVYIISHLVPIPKLDFYK